MNRMIAGVFSLFVGFFTLLFGLVIAIPLTIAALFTGKGIEKATKANSTASNHSHQGRVLEGEYEEVSK